MQEPTKKILDREHIHTRLKRKLIDQVIEFSCLFFLCAVFYALFYPVFYLWLRVYAIYVHIVFIAIGIAICVFLRPRLSRIFLLSRMLSAHRYLVVEDEIEFVEENAIKGMHFVLHGHRGLRWEPRIEHAIMFKMRGKHPFERYELENCDGGDKVYLVLPEHKPEKVVLCYLAEQYELHI